MRMLQAYAASRCKEAMLLVPVCLLSDLSFLKHTMQAFNTAIRRGRASQGIPKWPQGCLAGKLTNFGAACKAEGAC